jgi:predicted RNA binding protein YcfA (HicA-like mRNA interferase family)
LSKIPQITGEEMIHLLERMGFYVKRKKGAHHFLYHLDDPSRFALVSVHSGETIPPSTLRNILTTSKISIDELRNQILTISRNFNRRGLNHL